jgi:hypothetical protein
MILDDLANGPVSHEAMEITKRFLNIFNVPFFVPLWLRVKIQRYLFIDGHIASKTQYP